MRLLHIIQSLDPADGGTAEAVRLLVAFSPPEIQPEVVCCDDPGAPFLQSFPCPVHALGKDSGFGLSRRLVRWLRVHRGEYDAAVAHGLWNLVAHATRRTLRGHLPYAVFAHGMLDPYFRRRFPLKHAKKWPYWLATEYWTLRAAERVLFTAEAEAQLAEQSFEMWRWQPEIVSLGTTPAETATAADCEAFLQMCPGVRGRRFVLFLGRLHPKKGVDLLVRAFSKAAERWPEVDVVLAGPPAADHAEWLAAVKAEVSAAGLDGRVHWPGMVSGAAKRGAFALCEAFTLPSHQENFGVAVAEALAAARPVLLSTEINIAPEIAADGAGLMEPDTAEGTLRLLERWLSMSTEQHGAMQAQALRTFGARYDIRKNAARLGEVLQRVRSG